MSEVPCDMFFTLTFLIIHEISHYMHLNITLNIVSQLFRYGKEKLRLSLSFSLKPTENVSNRKSKRKVVACYVNQVVCMQTF